MNNNSLISKTLGPVSATLLKDLLSQGKIFFTLDDACAISGKSRQQISNFLRDLVNREILARIKSGVFLILQMGHESTQLDNWPIIAHFLADGNDYFISYYSAMRLHGMTTHPLLDVTLTMSKRNKSKKIHNISYQFIYIKPEHFWGADPLWVSKQNKVWISDLERTLLDGFDRPELCGGIIEVVKGIWTKQKDINWTKLVEYAKNYHSKAAVKRLGYILEKLNIGIECIHHLEKIIEPRKDYILLDPNGAKAGSFLSRWRVQQNINVDEIKASVWG